MMSSLELRVLLSPALTCDASVEQPGSPYGSDIFYDCAADDAPGAHKLQEPCPVNAPGAPVSPYKRSKPLQRRRSHNESASDRNPRISEPDAASRKADDAPQCCAPDELVSSDATLSDSSVEAPPNAAPSVAGLAGESVARPARRVRFSERVSTLRTNVQGESLGIAVAELRPPHRFVVPAWHHTSDMLIAPRRRTKKRRHVPRLSWGDRVELYLWRHDLRPSDEAFSRKESAALSRQHGRQELPASAFVAAEAAMQAAARVQLEAAQGKSARKPLPATRSAAEDAVFAAAAAAFDLQRRYFYEGDAALPLSNLSAAITEAEQVCDYASSPPAPPESCEELAADQKQQKRTWRMLRGMRGIPRSIGKGKSL